MAERKRTSVPAGEADLTGGHPGHGENIKDGGVGPSGSGFTSSGRLGGLRGSADGRGSSDEGDPGASDHGASRILDTDALDTDAPLRRHRE